MNKEVSSQNFVGPGCFLCEARGGWGTSWGFGQNHFSDSGPGGGLQVGQHDLLDENMPSLAHAIYFKQNLVVENLRKSDDGDFLECRLHQTLEPEGVLHVNIKFEEEVIS